MFKGMWRYTSLIDMVNIVKANAFGTILVIAMIGYFRGFTDIPRSVFVIDLILSFGFTSLSRIGIRVAYSHLLNPKHYAIQLNKRVIIIIEDDGPGIPEDQYKNVFKPFFRLDKSRSLNQSGVGLGLAIVEDIINSHGGNIILGKSKLNGLLVKISLPF